MNKVVIYPGRFQPMLSHHAEVFKQLQAQFPDADVYIGTSDKVELPKSPFNFKEKQAIAAAHGVPADRVLAVTRPYHQEDYAKYFDPANTIIIFAVGEKDLDRFPFNNMDPKTGLDMTVRGDPKPKYYQKINTLKANPKPMSERGYITLAPTIKVGNEIASASAFRDALKAAPDMETAKAIYTKQFGSYNDNVFKLIYNKIVGANMSEQINILRKLAGLSVQEAAPVEFDGGADPKTAKFLPPNASSSKMSIANRFPKGADVNDPATKKEQFINALLRSPEALIAEFSERLDPKDDNSLAVGQKLSDIVQFMNQKDTDMRGLPTDMKQFVLDLTVNAVKNMDLNAGDTSPAYNDGEDEFEKESVDLSDIRNDYGIEESKPDFLDLDKDGDKEESMKDAADDAEEEDEVKEGFSTDAERVLAQVGSGELDAYDVMNHPKTPAEQEAAKVMQDMYDEVAVDHHLHPDDDFEKILDIVADQLEADYGDSDEDTHEAVNPYAVGMASAMKSTGDKPPLSKRTIKKAHKIAKAVAKNEAVEETSTNAMEAALAELRKLAGLR